MTSTAPASLSTHGLGKKFRDRFVVENLDMKVLPGEVVGLLGPNGAGKTTSFNMIVGGLRPTTGTVRLDGRDVTNLPMFKRARSGIVYLPQEASVFRKLSVSQNIQAILETVEPNQRIRKQRLETLLAELGLESKASQSAESLSGGERRAVPARVPLEKRRRGAVAAGRGTESGGGDRDVNACFASSTPPARHRRETTR